MKKELQHTELLKLCCLSLSSGHWYNWPIDMILLHNLPTCLMCTFYFILLLTWTVVTFFFLFLSSTIICTCYGNEMVPCSEDPHSSRKSFLFNCSGRQYIKTNQTSHSGFGLALGLFGWNAALAVIGDIKKQMWRPCCVWLAWASAGGYVKHKWFVRSRCWQMFIVLNSPDLAQTCGRCPTLSY